MRKIKTILNIGSAFLFGTATGMLYAHVMDIEPHNHYDDYTMERTISGNNEFPSYAEWCNDNHRREEALGQWIGEGCVASFDVGYRGGREDTSCGGHASAPENCMQGERE